MKLTSKKLDEIMEVWLNQADERIALQKKNLSEVLAQSVQFREAVAQFAEAANQTIGIVDADKQKVLHNELGAMAVFAFMQGWFAGVEMQRNSRIVTPPRSRRVQ